MGILSFIIWFYNHTPLFVCFKGEAGLNGIPGFHGDKGDAGPPGPIGPMGVEGPSGEKVDTKEYH